MAVTAGAVELGPQPPATRAISAAPPAHAQRCNHRDTITRPSLHRGSDRPQGHADCLRNCYGSDVPVHCRSGEPSPPPADGPCTGSTVRSLWWRCTCTSRAPPHRDHPGGHGRHFHHGAPGPHGARRSTGPSATCTPPPHRARPSPMPCASSPCRPRNRPDGRIRAHRTTTKRFPGRPPKDPVRSVDSQWMAPNAGQRPPEGPLTWSGRRCVSSGHPGQSVARHSGHSFWEICPWCSVGWWLMPCWSREGRSVR